MVAKPQNKRNRSKGNMHRIFPGAFTAQKVMFSIEGFFSKFDAGKLEIWSHLLKKSLVENFIFVQCLLNIKKSFSQTVSFQLTAKNLELLGKFANRIQ